VAKATKLARKLQSMCSSDHRRCEMERWLRTHGEQHPHVATWIRTSSLGVMLSASRLASPSTPSRAPTGTTTRANVPNDDLPEEEGDE
jgi:anti-sigma factor RsiW